LPSATLQNLHGFLNTVIFKLMGCWCPRDRREHTRQFNSPKKFQTDPDRSRQIGSS